MSFISTIIGLISGVGGAMIYDAGVTGLAWWQSLLIAIIPTIVGALLDLLVYILKAKKIISSEDADKLIERMHTKEDEKKTEEDKGE